MGFASLVFLFLFFSPDFVKRSAYALNVNHAKYVSQAIALFLEMTHIDSIIFLFFFLVPFLVKVKMSRERGHLGKISPKNKALKYQ